MATKIKRTKKTLIHLIYIPFTGVGLYGGFRSQEWFAKRIEIFKQFTLKSLMNQSNKNFVCWISFRSQEKNNPLVLELETYLEALNFPFIFTFDGLMYADDRFFPRFRDRLPILKRVLRGLWRSKRLNLYAIYDCLRDRNSSLEQRIGSSVAVLKSIFARTDFVYVTRIDSDDMFHKDVVKELQDVKPQYKAVTIRKGYVFNRITRELSEWSPTTNPPFHTIIFPYDVFFDAEKHLQYLGGYRSHEDVVKLYDYTSLKGRRYCVVTHNAHISTTYNHRFRGEVIKNKKKILLDFGLDFVGF
mgnify:CR=1 FL=1